VYTHTHIYINTYMSGRWLIGLCCLAGSSAVVTLVNLLHLCLFLPYTNPHVCLKSTLILKVLRDMLLTTLVTQHNDMRQNRQWCLKLVPFACDRGLQKNGGMTPQILY